MQNIKIRHLQLFVRVAEEGSFSRVCSQLGLAQPTLSRTIRDLEGVVGLRLFERTGRGVKLSAHGADFLDRVRGLLDQFGELEMAVRRLRGQQIGDISISVPLRCSRLFLSPLLKAFHQKFESAALHVFENLNTDAHQKIRANEVKVSLIYAPPYFSGLNVEIIAHEFMYAVGRKDMFSSNSESIAMSQLQKLPILLQSSSAHFRTWIEDAFSRAGYGLKVARELETVDAHVSFAVEGEGIAILPYSNVWQEVESGLLSAVKIVEPVIERQIAIATGSSSILARETARLLKQEIWQCRDRARWLPIPSYDA